MLSRRPLGQELRLPEAGSYAAVVGIGLIVMVILLALSKTVVRGRDGEKSLLCRGGCDHRAHESAARRRYRFSVETIARLFRPLYRTVQRGSGPARRRDWWYARNEYGRRCRAFVGYLQQNPGAVPQTRFCR